MLYEMLSIISVVTSIIAPIISAKMAYRYSEEAWRKRRHLIVIKKKCLKRILSRILDFERWFRLEEDKISHWIESSFEPYHTDWCKFFSFGFEEPPITDYTILLHDLNNHFPQLVSKLKNFEKEMRVLCPKYSLQLYEFTKTVYELAKEVVEDEKLRAVLTEAVVMSITGHNYLSWPNDKKMLEKAGLLGEVEELSKFARRTPACEEFLKTRRKGIALITETKKEVLKTLYMNKLPGKCDIY